TPGLRRLSAVRLGIVRLTEFPLANRAGLAAVMLAGVLGVSRIPIDASAASEYAERRAISNGRFCLTRVCPFFNKSLVSDLECARDARPVGAGPGSDDRVHFQCRWCLLQNRDASRRTPADVGFWHSGLWHDVSNYQRRHRSGRRQRFG